MKKPDFVNKGDLLTMLLTIDTFMNDDKAIIDECFLFLIASTNATSMLISNCIYYLTRYPEHLKKIREEFKTVFRRDDFNNVTIEEWRELLSFDNVNDLYHLSMCVNETLRADPSGISFGFEVTEPVEVCGVKISEGNSILFNLHDLHMNPEEWFEPEKWIPERFDPNSKYYLTPAGKKRIAASFSPFFGGRRVCLGKTFAENIARH